MFAGVADANGDKVPLAVTEFAQGNCLDSQLGLLGLAGGGVGETSEAAHETYELAAWFFLNRCEFPNAKIKPILFFVADQFFYECCKGVHVATVCGGSAEDCPSQTLFAALRQKYEVFVVLKQASKSPYRALEPAIAQRWGTAIGPERVLQCESPKAVVDVMLGAIALLSGTRDMTRYIADMEGRGQSPERQDVVEGALKAFSEAAKTSHKYKDALAAAASDDEMSRTPSMDSVTMGLVDPRIVFVSDEQAELEAELSAAKAEITKLQLQTELAAAEREVLQRGGDHTGAFEALEPGGMNTTHGAAVTHTPIGIPKAKPTRSKIGIHEFQGGPRQKIQQHNDASCPIIPSL